MMRPSYSGGRHRDARRRAGIGFVCLAAILPVVALQFLPAPPRTNPPVDPVQTIEANLRMSEPVRATLYRACGDCHSNLTRWPWYSRVAPMSWLVAADVNAARGELNFSEWSSGPGATANLSVSWLTMACADIQAERMPLKRYLRLHPESRLSPGDKQSLCNWTEMEIARLASHQEHEALSRSGISLPPQ